MAILNPTTVTVDAVLTTKGRELLGAITSKRLRHDPKQTELSKQILSAARLPFGDGGWTIGRRASQSTVCATVATALVTHYATRPPMDLDIMVG